MDKLLHELLKWSDARFLGRQGLVGPASDGAEGESGGVLT